MSSLNPTQQQQQQQQQDPSKLHSIYTALDSRNYSRAIKLSQQKPISSWPLTRALRAHALERCDRATEAIQTLRDLLGFSLQPPPHGENEDDVDRLLKKLEGSLYPAPTLSQQHESASIQQSWTLVDDTTLSTIAVTLRAYKLYDALIAMYSHAVHACERRLLSHPPLSVRDDYQNAIQGLFFSNLRLAMHLPALDYSVSNTPDWMVLKGTIQYSFSTLGEGPNESIAHDTTENTTKHTANDLIHINTTRIKCYEAMQGAAMQLARTFTHDHGTLYWSWAVLSILLHWEALWIQQQFMSHGSSDDEQDGAKLQQKCAMLPRLAESLCHSKLIGNGTTSISGEDWKLYLRSLLVQSKYTDSIDTLANQPISLATKLIHDEDDIRHAVGSVLQMSHRERHELLANVYFTSGDYSACVAQYQHLLTVHPSVSASGGEFHHLQWTSLIGMLSAALHHASSSCSNSASLTMTEAEEMALHDCQKFVHDKILHPMYQQSPQAKLQVLMRGPELLLVEIAAVRARRQFRSLETLLLNASTSASEVEATDWTLERYQPQILNQCIKSLREAIFVYMVKFAPEAACVYRDVKPYLCLWVNSLHQLVRVVCSTEERDITVVLNEIQQFASSLGMLRKESKHAHESTLSERKKRLRQYTTVCQILLEVQFMLARPKDFSVHSPMEEHESTAWQQAFTTSLSALQETVAAHMPTVEEMVEEWNHSIRMDAAASTEELVAGMVEQKEGRMGDDLILTAGCAIVRQALHHSSDATASCVSQLLNACAVLEHAVAQSPYNASLKLLLIRVYTLLCAPRRVMQLFAELGVKQIQVESLSYLTLGCCANGAVYTEASRTCMDILKLHRTTSSDVPQYVGEAFQSGNLTTALDMMRFQCGKMNGSVQLLHAKAMIMTMAPLIGFGTEQPHAQQHSSLIGSMHGLVGMETDQERVVKMITDSSDRHAAPSILKEASSFCVASEIENVWSSYSDNRDLTVCDFDLTTGDYRVPGCSDIAALLHIPTKNELILSSLGVGHTHAILVRTTLLMSVVKPTNKKKSKSHKKKADPPPTKPLQRRCESLRIEIEQAKRFFTYSDQECQGKPSVFLARTASVALRDAFMNLSESLLETCEMYTKDPSSVSSEDGMKHVFDRMCGTAERIETLYEAGTVRSRIVEDGHRLTDPSTLAAVGVLIPQYFVSLLCVLRNVHRLFGLLGVSNGEHLNRVTQSLIGFISRIQDTISMEQIGIDLSQNNPMDSAKQDNTDMPPSFNFASVSGEEIPWKELYGKAVALVTESHDASRELMSSILNALSDAFESCSKVK